MPNSATGPKRRLSPLDASFLYGESAVNPTHVGSIFFLDGEIPFDKLFDHMRRRLHISPRFRQRLVFSPFNLANATIEDDPDFKLENHVFRRSLTPGISETDAINEILREHFGSLMDRTRPLWRVTLYEGLPGRSVFVWAMHHAIVDGVSAFEMLNRLMDFTAHPPPDEPAEPWSPAPLPSAGASLFSAVRDLVVDGIDSVTRTALELVRDPSSTIRQAQTLVEAMQSMGDMAEPPAATPWNAGPAVSERNLGYLKMPFADYRAIRAAFGGTINDIVLTVLGEGAARYLVHHGWATTGKLRFGCPVNVRRPEEQVVLENRVSMMMPTTPAAPMDIVERLKQIAAETARIKASGAPFKMERLSGMSETIPPAVMGAMSSISAIGVELTAAMIKATDWKPTPRGFAMPPSGINFVATNVPGPQAQWYFAGYKVVDMVGLLPLGGNLGYGVAISSYNQNILFSMMADARLLPDVEKMKGFVAAAFNELRERIPGEIRAAA
ncbi:MAG TPA: wax ester/triacylglycerol synthase domain-containing protein [Candidatus Binataceae bacterium]|nr:wax ester/triacylglycerol synthase domain-containing protein [Candidatus Binataceae bacterium]